MKRNILLLVLLFATAFSAFAQIENEIQQSKKQKIEKGRAYLLEKFIDRDYEKVKEIKDFLMEMESEDYVALTPFEQWHILQWTKEYDVLIESLRHADSAYFASYNKKVFPEKDDLMRRLYLRGVEDKHLLKYNLDEAQLPAEDEAFLSLFVDWLVGSESSLNQRDWNIESDKFLADYPNSDYEWFVSHWIRKPYEVEGDWGWGMGFDLCSGFSTGSLAKPLFGIGLNMDIAYKRLFLFLGYDIMAANSRIDQSLVGGGICPSGTHVNWMPMYANLGYAVIDNYSIRVTPFVGVGGIIETYGTQKHPEYEELEKNLFLYQGGLSFDIKTHGMFEDGFIRIRYNCGIHGLGKESMSMVHLISVGAAGLSRGTKRVYYE